MRRLLTDPTNPGKSLLGAFLAAGQQGVSALSITHRPMAAGPRRQAESRPPPTRPIQPTASPDTASAHFEGYLQVPTDGPYRFFAELGDTGAAAALTAGFARSDRAV